MDGKFAKTVMKTGSMKIKDNIMYHKNMKMPNVFTVLIKPFRMIFKLFWGDIVPSWRSDCLNKLPVSWPLHSHKRDLERKKERDLPHYWLFFDTHAILVKFKHCVWFAVTLQSQSFSHSVCAVLLTCAKHNDSSLFLSNTANLSVL